MVANGIKQLPMLMIKLLVIGQCLSLIYGHLFVCRFCLTVRRHKMQMQINTNLPLIMNSLLNLVGTHQECLLAFLT